jgi:MoaA/NifB/PqqE/SkfB family radical SAM enzyme
MTRRKEHSGLTAQLYPENWKGLLTMLRRPIVLKDYPLHLQLESTDACNLNCTMPWTLDEGRMGHLGKQTFAEIWNGDKYRELREALSRGERPTRSCKTCYPQDLYNVLSIKSKLLP